MSEFVSPPDRLNVGDEITPSALPITYRRMIVNVASSWDLFPGHYDPEYARAHGHPTVFANTSLFLAFVDRTITDWSGPRTRIMRRKLRMIRPVHAGEVMHARGVVVGTRGASDDRFLHLDLEIIVTNGVDTCAVAEATIEVPSG